MTERETAAYEIGVRDFRHGYSVDNDEWSEGEKEAYSQGWHNAGGEVE